ncbi:hypothetical protein ON010_g8098 [Phytophthora cinnamomi]|nr:hypothetical protein ON010_g8098 [Phytophthora cinnamomi]
MGCDESNVHAGIISEKATAGMLRDDADLRDRLRLRRELAYSEDNLVKETYEWTPELLVYIDEWRRHRDSSRYKYFGFDRRERYCDFLPQFPIRGKPFRGGRRIPRKDVLDEIGFHLCSVDFAWRASRLGTSDFRSMRIEHIGNLERKIKRSLGAVVDLVYKMMLARWMDRKTRSAAWWGSLELREEIGQEDYSEEEVEKFTETGHENSTIDEEYHDDDNDPQGTTDAESVEQKEFQRLRTHFPPPGGFRRPAPVVLSAGASRAKEAPDDSLVLPRPALDHIIRLGDIYAWTDDDINSFHRDAKRIDEVRAVIIALRDRLEWSKVSLEVATNGKVELSFGDPSRNDWRVSCVASHVCSLTARTVAFAEETAMHDATIALAKRPSLRLVPGNATSDDTGDKSTSSETLTDSTVAELQESVQDARLNVADLLAPYDGARTPEWCSLIQSAGRGTIQLLRCLARDEFLCEVDRGSKADEA